MANKKIKAKDLVKPDKTEIIDTKEELEDNIQKNVERMLKEGASVIDISKKLDITLNSVLYWVDRINTGGKPNIVDSIRKSLDSDTFETYDMAKRYSKTPAAISRLVRKAELDFSPVADWIKRASKSGIRYSRMKRELGLKSLDRAKEVLKETFKDCFIVCTPTGLDDFVLTPVHSSKEDVEWINIDTSKRLFDYYVSPEGNYMCVNLQNISEHEEIVIFNLTDLHIGSVYYRKSQLDSLIKLIKDTPNYFAVIGGDVFDANTKISVGSMEEQYLTNSQQLLESVRVLSPIADKIIAYRSGNHCRDRLMKAGQFDSAEVLASILKVPYFYTRVIIDIEYKGQRKLISLDHKYGNAFSIGAVEAAVDKIQSYNSFFINCFLSGHNHRAAVIPKESLELIPGKGFKATRWWIGNGGSTMQRTGSYAEVANYGPTPQDFVFYKFDSRGNDEAGLHKIHGI